MRKQGEPAGSGFGLAARGTSGLLMAGVVSLGLQAGCRDSMGGEEEAALEMPAPRDGVSAVPRTAETVVQHLRPPGDRIILELEVPRGARIGMVARAASTSVADLIALNPKLEGNPPSGTGGEKVEAILVPDTPGMDVARQLQELLQSEDTADLCVEEDFNWGAEQFTEDMRELCEEEKLHEPLP